VLEIGEVTARGPVESAPPFAAFVLHDRGNHERRIGAALTGSKTAREHQRAHRAGARERRALAEGQARIGRQRGALRLRRELQGAIGIDGVYAGIVKRELRMRRLAEQLFLGRASMRIRL
jgi:hypothetical protein